MQNLQKAQSDFVENTVISNPDSIYYYNLARLKAAVKLEKNGLKHSSGKSAKKYVINLLKLTGKLTHDQVINKIEEKMISILNQTRN